MLVESWQPDSTLVSEVEQQFESALAAYAAKPTLITEHANHEESIRTGGYANRTLLELVQNAADAMAGEANDSAIGRVEIVLDTHAKVLYCANSGRPFSKNGLTAITHAHLSAKRGDEIGRFGLGFKSVLAVTESPQVLSRSVAFEFNSQEARAAVSRLGASDRRLPILRTSTLVNAERVFEEDQIARELASWASTIVRLPNIQNVQRIRREIQQFTSEFLLFATAVREIHLSIRGEEDSHTSHKSISMGDGRFKIERPDGSGDEWLVRDRMHAPSADARREVGEAVSRSEIKVSVAIPLKPRVARPEMGDLGTKVGQFWSYFPLQDRTSATGFFNAPWSVNDDRTTLLRNRYNREILETLSEMFVETVPFVSSPEDPANHLEFFPARGREALSFGDEVLCQLIPAKAAKTSIIPDGEGILHEPRNLRPLDFNCEWKVPAEAHEGWIISPNTQTDVPHWRCYSSLQRITRLRQLFVAGAVPDGIDIDRRDSQKILKELPKRGILSWLREWADGEDMVSAANALRVVIANRSQPEASEAKIIPTSDGLRALSDSSMIFLSDASELEIEGAIFVSPDFLSISEMEKLLRGQGFRDLDPIAILKARLSNLNSTAGPELQEKFWTAALDVRYQDAMAAIAASPLSVIKVPVRSGAWKWPQQVLDIDGQLREDDAEILLDRRRCVPAIAHKIGVVQRPVGDYSYEDETLREEYEKAVIAELNSRLSPGDRPIEKIQVYPARDKTQGPFSALLLFKEADASNALRESWTRDLLSFGDSTWECEDTQSNLYHRIKSPIRWAVEEAGLFSTTLGFRPANEVVSPSLANYGKLLPLYEGPRAVTDAFPFPDEVSKISPSVLKAALDVEALPTKLDDRQLVNFIVEVAEIAYPDSEPPRIPARVGRTIESRPTRQVYIATDDEQEDYLSQHQRPYLRAMQEQVEFLVRRLGCLRFEDSFAFSIHIEGQKDSEKLLDVYTGLRDWPVGDDLSNVTIAKADSVAKWVTTEEGVETQSLHSYRDGISLTVDQSLTDQQILEFVSTEFALGLNNADISKVLKVGLDHRLELMRQEAVSAHSDVERLEVYFGPDDLRDKLPKGLWQGLKSQKLVNRDTSVAELCLSVYGKDTIRELSDLFRQEGFPDVPTQWSGGSSTISWLRKMGFGPEFAGQRGTRQVAEFVVPGATVLPVLHDYQERISREIREVILEQDASGRRSKAMVELPTGAGKTRVATQTILQLFIDGEISGPVLWIAQSQELCEQAVQTVSEVWRGLCTEQQIDRPLTIGRLWEGNEVQEPDTEHSVIVATDAKLDLVREYPEYEWLASSSAVFIDEGHRAGSSSRYTRLLTWLGVDGRSFERPLIGLSATPFKGTSTEATNQLAARFGRRKLVAFEKNPYQELVKIGVLARVRHEILEGAEVYLTEAEAAEAQRLNRMSSHVMDRVAADHARMNALVENIMSLDEKRGRSVLVFTPNVLSSQVLAATLRYRGVEARSVSGQTGRHERREVIQNFKDGKIRVLTNCDLLTQGFDAPGVTALYIARPTFSPNAYIQMAGRGLRGPRNGGKDECLIVDMADNFGNPAVNNLQGFREYEELWKEQNRDSKS